MASVFVPVHTGSGPAEDWLKMSIRGSNAHPQPQAKLSLIRVRAGDRKEVSERYDIPAPIESRLPLTC